jgi:hypothetical protein
VQDVAHGSLLRNARQQLHAQIAEASLNSHIEVDGDTARARWYLFMPCTVAAGNQAMWRAGIDHETYARVAGIWMFRHKRSEPLMSVPFETGWATARFA